MTPDKSNLGKSAFFLKPSPIPKPLKGTYMTCTPAAHTKQVGFERLLARLQPVRDESGAASFANPALVTLGISTFCGGPSWTDSVALKNNRLGFIVDFVVAHWGPFNICVLVGLACLGHLDLRRRNHPMFIFRKTEIQ